MKSATFTEPRLLHSKGFIQLCVDKSDTDKSGSFLSVGTDGDVWIWTGDELDDAEYDPKSIKGRTHFAIAWHKDDVYIGYTSMNPQTGIEKPTVSRFEKNSLQLVTPVTSFSLDITTIDVSKSGKFLAVGSIDHIVKIIDMETGDVVRNETSGQIMCVAFDPKDEYLAVTATDGMLRVFSLQSKTEFSEPVTIRICSRIIDIEPSNSRLQLCWNLSGTILFVPALGCVRQFTRDSFKEIARLSPPDIYEMFSICCVSPCGTYMASSAINGSICVWNIEKEELLTCSKYQINGKPRIICSMFWHRSLSDTLFFADTEENICSLKKCTGHNSNEIDLAESHLSKRNFEAVTDDDEDTHLSADLTAIKKSYGFDEEGNFSGIIGESEKSLFEKKEAVLPVYKHPILPKTFVAGSTPEHLNNRYLKWNQYGTIISSNNGDSSAIEINWHDISVHPEIIIDNSIANFSVGDITDTIVALGSVAQGECLSELQVHCINAWDFDSRQWNITLPEKESIENIVIGKKFIVVATSERYFRTFSHAGTQKIVFCYAGPLLTMCAFEDVFTAVTVKNCAFYENDGSQFDFVANIYKMNIEGWYQCQSLVQSVPISVSKNSKLDWIGYTNRGTLCVMDSKCCCRILSSCGVWIPVYNFSSSLKTKSDHIFPISFIDFPQCEIRYLYCRGTSYPLVESRLVPAVVKWVLPLCNQDSERSKIEEKLLFTEIQRSALNDGAENLEISTSYTKDVVKLFALACKADRQCRAAEFAEYSCSDKVIQSLCNFASKTRHPLLAEKVAEIGRINAEKMKKKSDIERKRNALVNDKKEDDFLAPKRLKEIENESNNASNKVTVKTIEKKVEPLIKKHDTEFESTPSSDSSSIFVPQKQCPLSNPYKRKSQDIFEPKNDGFFDSLASPSSNLRKLKDDSSEWKKIKASKSRQTLLSLIENEEPIKKATGFELWLKSSEDELKASHDGKEDFLKYATKQFRNLKTEEKQHWNHLARMDKAC